MNKHQKHFPIHTNNDSSNNDINIIDINLAIFGIFIALVFSYFVYFSHQLTEVKSEIYAKILEINAINPPHPLSFLSITGHKEYFYLKRREILFNEFSTLTNKIQESNIDENVLLEYGKQSQVLLTQIAYFFPYKRMLDFQQDESVTFDPNRFEAIETVENLKTNVPGYAVSPNSDRSYNPEFLVLQINHIINSHRRFTLELIDSKDKIIQAMILSNGLNNDYRKMRLKKYIESLIDYLENHYKLAIPLGLLTSKYNFLNKKANKKVIIALSVLLFVNFFSGVVLPLFCRKIRNNKIYYAIPLGTFLLGVIILFYVSLYSLPI